MLTVDRLRELLNYDQETGVFTWRGPMKRGQIPAGAVAGYVTPQVGPQNGYRQIRIDNGRFQASRLAWLWMTGEWPADQVNHINNERADDRWCNLREATNSQCVANSRCYRSSTSGLKGVSWCRKTRKWRAQTNLNGRKRVHLGIFDTPEAAHTAYAAAAKKAFGEFARASWEREP